MDPRRFHDAIRGALPALSLALIGIRAIARGPTRSPSGKLSRFRMLRYTILGCDDWGFELLTYRGVRSACARFGPNARHKGDVIVERLVFDKRSADRQRQARYGQLLIHTGNLA